MRFVATALSTLLGGGAAGGCSGDPSPARDAAPADDAAGATRCPSVSNLVEGGGLVATDRGAFPLRDPGDWEARAATVDELATRLEVVDLAGVLAGLDRAASAVAADGVPGSPPGVRRAFRWAPADQAVATWIPQGITTSGDGLDGGRFGDRMVVLVSWYHDPAADPEGAPVDQGVRVAVVDATDPDAVRYGFVLLVEPVTTAGRVDLAPVAIHAGGLAWVGRHLYVADTRVGFRVFDLGLILRVDPSRDDVLGYDAASDAYHAHGVGLVLPQVATIQHASACSPRFSFVSLDRSTRPPSLLSGEYDDASIGGRLFRWPFDVETGRLSASDDDGTVRPIAAWLAGHSHLQGALSLGDRFWLSSSKPPGAGGVLYRAAEGQVSDELPWNDSPEDLSYDPVDDEIWSLSEGLGARYVFSVDRAAVDRPPM